MTTRSGVTFKPMMESERPATEDSSTQEDTAHEGATSRPAETPDVTGIMDMMRIMIQDRERREQEVAEERKIREAERAEERRRFEEANERRIRDMTAQMELLREMVNSHSTAEPRRESEPVKLTRLAETDDIESYLTIFERMMRAYEVSETRWAFKLAPQLTGRAQQAYAALSPDDAKTYATVKAAILCRYDINEETYRKRFRSLQLKSGEMPRELVTRLTDLATKWLKDCTTAEEVRDVIIKEQLLATLPDDVRVWVTERKPKTSKEAGQLAEDYLQARSSTSTLKPTPTKQEKPPPGRCPRCGEFGHWGRYCTNPKPNNGGSEPPRDNKPPNSKPTDARFTDSKTRSLEGIRCYRCNKRGHFASNCPEKSLYCDQAKDRPPEQEQVCRGGTINGVYCRDILVDTGATKTLIRKELVTDDDILDGDVSIRCAHGDIVSYPVAAVKISIGGRDIITTAAVSSTLPASALLGWDIPQLTDLINETHMRGRRTGCKEETPDDALAVTTRSQHRGQAGGDGQSPSLPPEAATAEPESEDDIFNFHDSIFSPPGRQKSVLTRSQKRDGRRRHRNSCLEQGPPKPENALDISADELRVLQEQDETLHRARVIADGGPNVTAGEAFVRRDGLLYRRYQPPGADDEARIIEQLVLPTRCRPAVMRLAHDIPMSGHLGKKKTAKRVLQRFYWPGLYRDVQDYCLTCGQCQKSSTRRVRKAPLVPLPIMDAPFKRIAMDIVGPLPRSSSGKRFILVICDYATRYPEAIALRTMDANTIAEELVQFFARVGIPEEILTDQGTNFNSQLLAEVYRLLHIKPIRTTPYHPQTDGLVERFNHTLKSMLRKTATEGKDWDRLLPYLLFAYREVPQASTGFSPFELLYGHHVRGPLDVLKETWETSPKSSESIVSYVLNMQERLTKLRDVVHENLGKAQAEQKKWYDRNSRDREFQVGDQVLVLLPTSTNKLLAEWCGPYPVIRKIGGVNYEIKMTDRKKQKRIFHINMLRQWNSPSAMSLLAEEVQEEVDDVILWDDSDEGEAPVISNHLDSAQRRELDQLLYEFRDVLSDNAGRTSVTEHRIQTGETPPIRLPPYRLPHAYRETVKTELEQMENDGVIERSSSEWAAPIVLVKKKDGSLRMCVDYRRLNAVAKADAYPMPRVDDLVDNLGEAKFISTLDLARGYWQVPMEEKSRPLTAFTTPYGLFQFKVMPFGLHGAPATFQRMMDKLLAEDSEYAAAYLDDVVIHSRSWDDHIRHLRTIFQRLQQAGLRIKPRKCQFAMKQCSYLGHIVGNSEIRPEESKIHAVADFPTPTTKKQVRAFLGLTGYYRKFISDYADTAVTLTDLTKKNAPNRVVWTPKCEEAFKTLKERLCSSPVLRSPDFSRTFVLQTDASDRGVGAVLSQRDDDEVDHPVAFYSRKLLPREERYSTIEKECLAIKLATHAFRVYLLGRRFEVQTDHRALEWLNRLKDHNARLTRWSLALQPYDFVVRYRAGKANGNADALSRAYSSPASTTSSQEKGGGV